MTELFKYRNLNIAIIISASCHLIFMFAITPVLLSAKIRENTATVSFLGSILEKIAIVPEKPLALNRVTLMDKIERMKEDRFRSSIGGTFRSSIRGHFPSESVPYEGVESVPYEGVESVPYEGTESAPYPEQRDKEKFVFSEDKYRTPLFNLHYKRKEKPKIKFKDILVEGEARNRLLLYKPELHGFPTLPSNFSSNYNVRIRFKISQDGFVERPECVISSGSSEVDQMAIRYIRRWQFVPLDEVQEGIVRVVYTE